MIVFEFEKGHSGRGVKKEWRKAVVETGHPVRVCHDRVGER